MTPVFIKIGQNYYNLDLLWRVEVVTANSFNLYFIAGAAVNVNRAVVDEIRQFVTLP